MKSFEVVVNAKIEPEIQKVIKHVLKPVHSIGQPEHCFFCDTDTTWTINNKPVCPKCAVQYGFLSKQWLLDPCEVCGKQGEWATEGDPQHFLCYIHRNIWFRWNIPELQFIDGRKQPEKWHQLWDEGWIKFVSCMKERG